MTPRKALISALVVAGVAGLALIAERQAEAPARSRPSRSSSGSRRRARQGSEYPALQLPARRLGALAHSPDAHEFGYQLDGEFTLLIGSGEPSRS